LHWLLLAFAAGWFCNTYAGTLGISDPFRPETTVARVSEPTTAALPPVASPKSQTIQAYFSPRGGTLNAIIGCIDEARSEIVVALYVLTNADLADALVRAHKRGVRVEAILDKAQQTARGGQVQKLIDANIPVRFDTKHAIFHHKFAVIDGATLVTGSFNWSAAAEKSNAENTLIIRNNPDLAAQFSQAFAVLKNSSTAASDR